MCRVANSQGLAALVRWLHKRKNTSMERFVGDLIQFMAPPAAIPAAALEQPLMRADVLARGSMPPSSGPPVAAVMAAAAAATAATMLHQPAAQAAQAARLRGAAAAGAAVGGDSDAKGEWAMPRADHPTHRCRLRAGRRFPLHRRLPQRLTDPTATQCGWRTPTGCWGEKCWCRLESGAIAWHVLVPYPGLLSTSVTCTCTRGCLQSHRIFS